jgi:23S rRNA pseudouridine1911/1915/1917 synthase
MANIITEKKLNFEIDSGTKNIRIDIFLTNHIENATRTKVQKLIKEGFVLVNGKTVKPNYKIMGGESLDVRIPITPRPDKIEAEDIPLEIVYEDEFLLIVNKPAGMVVHPALGHSTGTLVNALLHHTNRLSEAGDEGRPGIVHRIDKDTSGLLLIAKDEWTHAQLAKQFAAHTLKREYQAVVWGLFKQREGEIISNLVRSKKDRKLFTVSETEGKFAHTNYEVLEEFEFASLLKLNLKTGRTHQIRVHLSSAGHPIFGDPNYGGRRIVYGGDLSKLKARVNNLLEIMPRQALHAKTLGFYHPELKKDLFFSSELPEDMQKLIERLKTD